METKWEHPLNSHFKQMVIDAKQKKYGIITQFDLGIIYFSHLYMLALSYHTFTKGFPAPPRGDVVKTGRKYKVPAKITVIDLEAVPIDDNPANYQPTEAEINEYAKFLGFDLMKDKECLYVAKEGLEVFLFYLFIFRVN